MAGEFGGPPGVPEFQAPKSDDSSDGEKKKSVFGFIKRREGEDEASKAEAAAAKAETDDDDDEKDGNWFRMLSKKFGGSVAVGSVEDEPAQEAPAEVEAGDNEVAEEPVEIPETEEVSPYSFAEASTEDEPDMPEITLPAVENLQEDRLEDESEEPEEPVHATVEAPKSAAVEAEPEEPEETENASFVAPAVPPAPPEIPPLPHAETEPAEEPEEAEETPDITTDTGGGAGTGPNILNTPAASAPEALPPAPDTTKTGNALPAVALGVGLYAHHRINKARREVERQAKVSQQEAQSTLKKEQIRQRVEDDRRAWNPNTAAAVWAPAEVEQPKPKTETADKTAKTEQLEKRVEELEKATKTELKEVEKPEAAQTKERIETKVPSVGEVLAERKAALPTTEVVSTATHEQQVDTLLKPELADPTAEINFRQIESLAEQDVAIENQYERQHEAKDVSTPAFAGTSGAINTNELFQKDDPNAVMTPITLEPALHSAPKNTLDLSDPVNQQAMKMGAMTAVLIILATMLWSIVA